MIVGHSFPTGHCTVLPLSSRYILPKFEQADGRFRRDTDRSALSCSRTAGDKLLDCLLDRSRVLGEGRTAALKVVEAHLGQVVEHRVPLVQPWVCCGLFLCGYALGRRLFFRISRHLLLAATAAGDSMILCRCRRTDLDGDGLWSRLRRQGDGEDAVNVLGSGRIDVSVAWQLVCAMDREVRGRLSMD